MHQDIILAFFVFMGIIQELKENLFSFEQLSSSYYLDCELLQSMVKTKLRFVAMDFVVMAFVVARIRDGAKSLHHGDGEPWIKQAS